MSSQVPSVALLYTEELSNVSDEKCSATLKNSVLE
jgi:hypothetical protein